MYKFFFKRFLDLLISLIGLVVIFPLLLIVYIMLYKQNKGSAFFFQERPGKGQKPFNIIKFKTMSDAKDSFGKLAL